MKEMWRPVLAEFVGTALLIAVGLSIVILDFGKGSPVAAWIPSAGARRLLTGFLFGCTGATIAVSWVGKVSGAHINPVVSGAFWMLGKMRGRLALAYAAAQCAGGLVGALPLLAWGAMGRSVQFGATTPGAAYGDGLAVVGELLTTVILIVGLLVFVGHKRLRGFTPAIFPPMYAVMVFLEAPVSGTSTNPARSLGPMVLAGAWQGWWVYWVGPALGLALGVALYKSALFESFEVEVAKVYHFAHDPEGLFGVGEEAVEAVEG
jgi:aquaporin Z